MITNNTVTFLICVTVSEIVYKTDICIGQNSPTSPMCVSLCIYTQ